MSKQRFTVAHILVRADDLGIKLSVENGELKVKAPKGVLDARTRQVLADYKAELIEALTPYCTVCLEPALPDGYDGNMYCAAHHPAHQMLKEVG